jgi:methylated-DNA-[protein]-cysteine S-methyltransferase
LRKIYQRKRGGPMTYYKKIKSPVGELTLVATDTHLTSVWFDNKPSLKNAEHSKDHPILVSAESQLQEYFQGKRQKFDLPLESSGTEFQEKVWKALRKIPFGQTWSYKKLATTIGNPKACRAVGAANGKNPLSIVVPCHRVIGAQGSLTGFGGGLENKEILLNLERN